MFWTVGGLAILFLMGYGAWYAERAWVRWTLRYLLILFFAPILFTLLPKGIALAAYLTIAAPLMLVVAIIAILVFLLFGWIDARRRDRW